jgi:hypothetical protein
MLVRCDLGDNSCTYFASILGIRPSCDIVRDTLRLEVPVQNYQPRSACTLPRQTSGASGGDDVLAQMSRNARLVLVAQYACGGTLRVNPRHSARAALGGAVPLRNTTKGSEHDD